MRDPDQGYPIRPERKTALSVRSESNAKPLLVSPEADYQIPQKVWSNWTPASGQRELRRELTITERRVCAHRAVDLKRGLQPFTADQREGIDFALSRMLAGFQRHLNVEPFVDTLLDLLREFPAWAIVNGCLKITHDQHGLTPPFNPNFGPSDNQIYQVVAGIVSPYRTKLTQAEALLSAPIEQKAEDILPKQTWEQAKAELRQRGMKFGDDPKSVETADTVMAKLGISQAQWDAIPDLPKDHGAK